MSYSNQTIYEGAEPENFFWVAMGGRGAHDTVSGKGVVEEARLKRCGYQKTVRVLVYRVWSCKMVEGVWPYRWLKGCGHTRWL